MPNILDSFSDPYDDAAYASWMNSHADAICQDLAVGAEQLHRITALVHKHMQALSSPVRLRADVNLLQRAILGKQLHDVSLSKFRSVYKSIVDKLFAKKSDLQIARDTLTDLERLVLVSEALNFALLNLFMDVDLPGSPLFPRNALTFMTDSLETHRDQLPKESHPKLDSLLQKYRGAFEMDNRMEMQLDQNGNTINEFHHSDEVLQDLMLAQLKQGESVYLASGWVGDPVGHMITLELVPHRSSNGKLTITGQIHNRGEGLEYHATAVKGNKIVHDPRLMLDEVTIEDLENSSFLSALVQLRTPVQPTDPSDNSPRFSSRATAFTASDFYDVFLSSWPGAIHYPDHPHFETDQRGPFCSIKPFISEMKAMLGNEVGEIAKFYLTKDCWEAYISRVGITEDNVDQMEPLLEKFALRSLKLKDHLRQKANPELLRDCDNTIVFCARVRQLIAATKETRTERLLAATVALDKPVIESSPTPFRLPAQRPLPTIRPPPPASQPPQQEQSISFALAVDQPEAWISHCLAAATVARDASALLEAQSLCLEAIRALPNPSEEIWNNVQNRTQIVKELWQIQQILFQSMRAPDNRMVLSPQQACVWTKIFGITYRVAKQSLPLDLCQYYARGLRTIRYISRLFSPLNPADRIALIDTLKLVEADANSSESSVWAPQPRSDGPYRELKISSLEEIRKNPELAFLYEQITPHRELWLEQAKQSISGLDPLPETVDVAGVTVAYQQSFNNDSELGAIIPGEYLALRSAFYHFCFAFEYRGKLIAGSPLSEVGIVFNGSGANLANKDPAYVQVNFKHVEPLIKGQGWFDYDEFGDAFPGVAELCNKPHMYRRYFIPDSLTTDELINTSTISFTGMNPLQINPLQTQDLAAIASPGALVLPQLEHYFKKNITHLESPFMQSLFLVFLGRIKLRCVYEKDFDIVDNAIITALERWPHSQEIPNFFAFLDRSLQTARTAQSWRSYCFLLRVFALTLSQCAHHVGNTELIQGIIKSLQTELAEAATQVAGINTAHQAIFDNHLLAMVSHLADRDELYPLAVACENLRSQLTVERADCYLAQDFHLREDIQNGRMTERKYPELLATARRQGNKRVLPPDIYTDNIYQQLFGICYPAEELAPGYFQFTDSTNTTYRIYNAPRRTVRLFRQWGEPSSWYELSKKKLSNGYPATKHPCSSDGYFNANTIAWSKVEGDPELFITQRDGLLLGRVTGTALYHPVFPSLTLIKDYSCPVIETLARLSPHTKILAWKEMTTEALTRIELPEHDLQFEAQPQESGVVNWTCARYPGFYLDTQHLSVSFEPFPHYVVIRNALGERKVIVLSKQIESQKMSFAQPLKPKVRSGAMDTVFVYDLDAKGKVRVPQTQIPEMLYLLHLALSKQDYSLASKTLNALQRQREPWNSSLEKLIPYFELSSMELYDTDWDTHPQATALRLQLMTLRLSRLPASLENHQLSLLELDYFGYLNQLNNLTPSKRLSPEQEAVILGEMTKLSLSPNQMLILQRRHRILGDAQSLSHLSPPSLSPTTLATDRPARVKWLRINVAAQRPMIEALTNPCQIAFSMRPGAGFFKNFLYYYETLRNGHPPQEVAKILELIRLCRNDPNNTVQAVRSMLMSVSQNRAVPPVEELIIKLNKNIDALESVFSDREPVQEESFYDKITTRPRSHGFQPHYEGLNPTPPINHPVQPLTFQNIPDDLLRTLVANNGIIDRVPNQTEIDKLQQDITELRELETLYQQWIVKSSHPSVQAEYRRLLQGIQQKLGQAQEKLVSIQNISQAHNAAQLAPDQRILAILETLYQQWIVESSHPSVQARYRRLLQRIQQKLGQAQEKLVSIQNTSQAHNAAQLAPDQRILAINDDLVNTMISDLTNQLNTARNDLESAERQLTARLHSYNLPALEAERQAGLLTPLTLQEALIHFGRNDDEPFYKANPGLQPEALQDLKEEIGRYLMVKGNTQKMARFKVALQAAADQRRRRGSESLDYVIAKQHALKILGANRAYEPQAAPHLLVYEAFADITLRPEQLAALEQLTRSDADDNIIFEARTGFGKSKTLIPLWLFLTSEKRRREDAPGTAMMTVLPMLFPQQVVHLKKTLGGAFQQVVFSFRFDRDKGNDLAFLKDLNQQFDIAAKEGMCELTTVHSLHGLTNLKIKELFDLDPSPHTNALLVELHALRMKAQGLLSNFFDESRECFDIRNYFDYAIGSAQPLGKAHCQAVETVYDILLDQQVPCDFLPNTGQDTKPPLTEEQYHNTVKADLAKILMERLVPAVLPEPDGNRYLLYQLLTGTYNPKIAPYLESLTTVQITQLSVYCDQLNLFLPRTLTRPCNGRYGLAEEKTGNRLAYPFERGVPKLTSQFATSDDLMDFTIQANLKTPFSRREISNWVKGLKIRYAETRDKGTFIANDADYHLYRSLTKQFEDWPANLTHCGQREILTLHQAIENDPKLKLKFITGYVLPMIRVHKEKISSSAHNLADVIHKIYGASATVNTDTLSPRLTTLEEATTPIGSLQALWKHSQQAVFAVDSANATELLQNTLAEHPDYGVIIDAAGLFRDLRDEKEVARLIFAQTVDHYPPVDAVSFYDEAGENYVYLRPKPGEPLGRLILREDCSCDVENVFVFIRQSAAVGADTPMSLTAKALVTVDGSTQRDLFFQGLGRLREILNGQRAGILMRKQDSAPFRNDKGELDLAQVLQVVSSKQGEERGRDLFYNLQLLLQNLMERQFWVHFDKQDVSLPRCRKLFQSLRKFFVESMETNPLLALQQTRGDIRIQDAVEQIKRDFERKLSTLMTEEVAYFIDLKAVMVQFEGLIDYAKLPPVVNMGLLGEGDRVVDVALEAADVAADSVNDAASADSDQAADRDRSTFSSLPYIEARRRIPEPTESYRSFGIDESSALHRKLSSKPDPNLLSGLYVSTNLLSFHRQERCPKGGLQTVYEYLVIEDNGQLKVVLMNKWDGFATMEAMGKTKEAADRNYYLLSSTGKVIVKDTKQPNQRFDRALWERNPQLSLITKIFTRQWNFSETEVDYLRSLHPSIQKQYVQFFDQEIAYAWPPEAGYLAALKERFIKA